MLVRFMSSFLLDGLAILELSHIGEGFDEVGDELVFHCGLDDHIVFISLDVYPDLGLHFWITFWYVALAFFRPKVMTL
jgi:hypothetical protein